MRTCAAAALLLGATALVAVPAGAVPAAAAAACHGRPATIVVGPGETRAAGTPGDDVVLVVGSGVEVDTGPGDDLVCATGALGLDVDLGPGTDLLTLTDPGDASPYGRVEGGGDPGDELEVTSTVGLDVDLRAARTLWSGTTNQAPVALSVRGFNDVVATAPTVSVAGDGRDNRLLVSGCTTASLLGRGGDDTLMSPGSTTCTGGARSVASGGPGNDRVYGGPRNDVLRGGPGRDHADGRAGLDRCSSFVRTRSCER